MGGDSLGCLGILCMGRERCICSKREGEVRKRRKRKRREQGEEVGEGRGRGKIDDNVTHDFRGGCSVQQVYIPSGRK